jgi:diguanylate cyclase (GGDEF)-like protein/PAS domain S-box-containing protein
MPTPLRALLIEDSEDDALLVLRELRRGGFDPLHYRRVDTADAMTAALVDEPWDVILSDYTMPKFNLMAAIAILKGNGFDIPLIVITGTIGEERAVETLKAGAQDYLLKGNLVRLPSSVNNVLNEARAMREAQAAHHLVQKLSQVVEQTADGVFITDIHGIVEYANPAFEQMCGYSVEELLGHDTRFLKSGHHDDKFYQSFWQTVLAGKTFQGTFINLHKDGALFYEEKVVTPLVNQDGEIMHFVSTGRDITERLSYENRLRHQATHDHLTGLPNRILLEDRLQQAIAFAERNQHAIGVAFVDLDNFKRINDAYGHAFGDLLLRKIAQNLQNCCRDSDTLGRLGGDEFVIVLGQLDTAEDACNIPLRLQTIFNMPYVVEEVEIFVTASIGISVYPEDGKDTDSLLKNADAAMYHVKAQGKNGFQLYSPEMNARHRERLNMEAALRRALDLEQFVLYYQPQIDIASGEVFGVEALLRWRHPRHGLLQPIDFVPILEETGLIIPVGEWVLQTACRQKQLWRGMGLQDLNMAINISGRQFTRKNLVHQLHHLITTHCGDVSGIELEITESVVMANAASAIAILKELNDLGIRLAIDDFGTGYSSLSYLRQFPIHTLKVDQSFVRDIARNGNQGESIVVAILSMAQALGLSTVAEGVETREQLGFLANRGCDYAQGFYYSESVNPETLEKLLLTA